jgi:syndecan 4
VLDNGELYQVYKHIPKLGYETMTHVFIGGDVTIDSIQYRCGPGTPCEANSDIDPRMFLKPDGTLDLEYDNARDGGNWMIIQRRTSGDVDFYKGWQDYELGFGEKGGSFWLGLESMYRLCGEKACELRIDMTFEGKNYYEKYKDFSLTNADDNFRLHVGEFEGDAGDSLSYHNGQQFSTNDKDNDAWKKNCASRYKGAWWYKRCMKSCLNGSWGSSGRFKGILWRSIMGKSDSLEFVEMKVRPM